MSVAKSSPATTRAATNHDACPKRIVVMIVVPLSASPWTNAFGTAMRVVKMK